MDRFESAQMRYEKFGVDVQDAMRAASETPISINCWQGDDVAGFDQPNGAAGDGIQTTGNYPGRARNFEELTAPPR